MLANGLRPTTFQRFARRLALAGGFAVTAAVCSSAPAFAAGGGVAAPTSPPHSQRISSTICKTTGGGKFVPIPGFPGEKIDRRLIPDIRWIVRKFHVFVYDGYSLDPVHVRSGEHPIGLAVDLGPGRGGSWAQVTQLAKFAEPRQNLPRMPWRWVGYTGDAGHGPGNHLHLSWAHSPTKYNVPAKVVYTRICPA
jgi:hypothetical protein